MIKAIETIYNGYRFRSRLEARWAVFFDTLGIKYEYEPEGFHLSDGTKYLPDFFLPGYDNPDGVYVEVKPDGGDFSKARQLARDNECSIILAEGVPDFKVVRIYEKYADFTGLDDVIKRILSGSFCKEYDRDAEKEIIRTQKDEVRHYLKSMLNSLDDQRLDDHFYIEAPGIFDLCEKWAGRLFIEPGVEDKDGYFEPHCFADENHKKAVLAAKQARFEHGEKPR